MKYDVFISFKNSGKDGQPIADAAAARRVDETLKVQGMRVALGPSGLGAAFISK